MRPSVIEFIRHIDDELTYCITKMQHLSYNDFVADETLTRAIVRSIEIIGEASKQIPVEFKDQYNQVPWKQMAGMCDRLIHSYFGVDYETVYNTVQQDTCPLEKFGWKYYRMDEKRVVENSHAAFLNYISYGNE